MSGFNGPVTVLKQAPIDYSAVLNTKDPLLAALELRYAQQVQQAQQGVQDAALLPTGDFIMGSPQQQAAKIRRAILRQQAAEQYNRGIPVGSDIQKKDIGGNPFYGA